MIKVFFVIFKTIMQEVTFMKMSLEGEDMIMLFFDRGKEVFNGIKMFIYECRVKMKKSTIQSLGHKISSNCI